MKYNMNKALICYPSERGKEEKCGMYLALTHNSIA